MPFSDSNPVEHGAGPKRNVSDVFSYAVKKSLAGGVPGALAMAVQVVTLMWMRTIMNYQYRYGTSMTTAAKTLYKDGGVLRFYKGFIPALVQGPLSRFGDTAANAGALALLEGADINVGVKTACASSAAGLFRIALMPLDCLKTSMQVEGKQGIPHLREKISQHGLRILYNGSVAEASATTLGHFPWFFTYNVLNERLPKAISQLGEYSRAAFIGFCASLTSDLVANPLKIIKTTKQTHREHVSYPRVVREILAKDGVQGLYMRGLQTSILSNSVQRVVFAVLWKYFEKVLFEK